MDALGPRKVLVTRRRPSSASAERRQSSGESESTTRTRTIFSMGPRTSLQDLSCFAPLDISKHNEILHNSQRLDTFLTPKKEPLTDLPTSRSSPASLREPSATTPKAKHERSQAAHDEQSRLGVQLDGLKEGILLDIREQLKDVTSRLHEDVGNVINDAVVAVRGSLRTEVCLLRQGFERDLSRVHEELEHLREAQDAVGSPGELRDSLRVAAEQAFKQAALRQEATNLAPLIKEVRTLSDRVDSSAVIAEIRKVRTDIDTSAVLAEVRKVKNEVDFSQVLREIRRTRLDTDFSGLTEELRRFQAGALPERPELARGSAKAGDLDETLRPEDIHASRPDRSGVELAVFQKGFYDMRSALDSVALQLLDEVRSLRSRIDASEIFGGVQGAPPQGSGVPSPRSGGCPQSPGARRAGAAARSGAHTPESSAQRRRSGQRNAERNTDPELLWAVRELRAHFDSVREVLVDSQKFGNELRTLVLQLSPGKLHETLRIVGARMSRQEPPWELCSLLEELRDLRAELRPAELHEALREVLRKLRAQLDPRQRVPLDAHPLLEELRSFRAEVRPAQLHEALGALRADFVEDLRGLRAELRPAQLHEAFCGLSAQLGSVAAARTEARQLLEAVGGLRAEVGAAALREELRGVGARLDSSRADAQQLLEEVRGLRREAGPPQEAGPPSQLLEELSSIGTRIGFLQSCCLDGPVVLEALHRVEARTDPGPVLEELRKAQADHTLVLEELRGLKAQPEPEPSELLGELRGLRAHLDPSALLEELRGLCGRDRAPELLEELRALRGALEPSRLAEELRRHEGAQSFEDSRAPSGRAAMERCVAKALEGLDVPRILAAIGEVQSTIKEANKELLVEVKQLTNSGKSGMMVTHTSFDTEQGLFAQSHMDPSQDLKALPLQGGLHPGTGEATEDVEWRYSGRTAPSDLASEIQGLCKVEAIGNM